MATAKKGETSVHNLFIYNVKFVWGIQNLPFSEICPAEKSQGAVLAKGIYFTEVNIFNYHDDTEARISKYYVQLVKENNAIGFEPAQQKAIALPKHPLVLKPNSATGDDSCGIAALVKARNQLNIGFLKIESDISLTVTAVYTLSDTAGNPVSIAVEQITENIVDYK